jgi:chemotaxis signal transduction protein
MKNVIVFAIEGSRYAVELRWVREVITLGFVTPVPGAPPEIVGVVNVHGTVTPVLDLRAALGEIGCAGDANDRPSPRRGDGAVVFAFENAVAAIYVSNVEEVSTLTESERDTFLIDSAGREVATVDCPTILRNVLATSNSTRETEEDEEENASS